jgi:tubulin alpha
MGDTCRELFCLEHGINKDGTMDSRNGSVKFFLNIFWWSWIYNHELLLIEKEHGTSMSTFFKRSDSGKYARNAIFVDLEPSVISEIRYGE